MADAVLEGKAIYEESLQISRVGEEPSDEEGVEPEMEEEPQGTLEAEASITNEDTGDNL